MTETDEQIIARFHDADTTRAAAATDELENVETGYRKRLGETDEFAQERKELRLPPKNPHTWDPDPIQQKEIAAAATKIQKAFPDQILITDAYDLARSRYFYDHIAPNTTSEEQKPFMEHPISQWVEAKNKAEDAALSARRGRQSKADSARAESQALLDESPIMQKIQRRRAWEKDAETNRPGLMQRATNAVKGPLANLAGKAMGSLDADFNPAGDDILTAMAQLAPRPTDAQRAYLTRYVNIINATAGHQTISEDDLKFIHSDEASNFLGNPVGFVAAMAALKGSPGGQQWLYHHSSARDVVRVLLQDDSEIAYIPISPMAQGFWEQAADMVGNLMLFASAAKVAGPLATELGAAEGTLANTILSWEAGSQVSSGGEAPLGQGAVMGAVFHSAAKIPGKGIPAGVARFLAPAVGMGGLTYLGTGNVDEAMKQSEFMLAMQGIAAAPKAIRIGLTEPGVWRVSSKVWANNPEVKANLSPKEVRGLARLSLAYADRLNLDGGQVFDRFVKVAVEEKKGTAVPDEEVTPGRKVVRAALAAMAPKENAQEAPGAATAKEGPETPAKAEEPATPPAATPEKPVESEKAEVPAGKIAAIVADKEPATPAEKDSQDFHTEVEKLLSNNDPKDAERLVSLRVKKLEQQILQFYDNEDVTTRGNNVNDSGQVKATPSFTFFQKIPSEVLDHFTGGRRLRMRKIVQISNDLDKGTGAEDYMSEIGTDAFIAQIEKMMAGKKGRAAVALPGGFDIDNAISELQMLQESSPTDLFGRPVEGKPISGKTGDLGIGKGEVTEAATGEVAIKPALHDAATDLFNDSNGIASAEDLFWALKETHKADMDGLLNNPGNPMPEIREAFDRQTKGGNLFDGMEDPLPGQPRPAMDLLEATVAGAKEVLSDEGGYVDTGKLRETGGKALKLAQKIGDEVNMMFGQMFPALTREGDVLGDRAASLVSYRALQAQTLDHFVSLLEPKAGFFERQTKTYKDNARALRTRIGCALVEDNLLSLRNNRKSLVDTFVGEQMSLGLGKDFSAQAVEANFTKWMTENQRELFGDLTDEEFQEAMGKLQSGLFDKFYEGEFDPAKFTTNLNEQLNLFKQDAKSIIGTKDCPFKTEKEWLDYLDTDEFKKAAKIFREIINPKIDNYFASAKNISLDDLRAKGARGFHTGIRISLAYWRDAELEQGSINKPAPAGVGTSEAGYTKYSKEARGTATAYKFDIKDILDDSLASKIFPALKNQFLAELQTSGAGFRLRAGRDVSAQVAENYKRLPRDIFTKVVVVTPAGEHVVEQENYWVKKELWNETKDALQMSSEFSKPVISEIAKFTNTCALWGLSEGITHLSNQMSVLFHTPGFKAGAWFDNARKLMARDPETLGRLVELAEIGTLREGHRPPQFKPGQGKKALLQAFNLPRYGGNLIQFVDNVGRLTMDDVFSQTRGLILDRGQLSYLNTTSNRRNFINQFGQYNRAAQPAFMRMMRDYQLAPFATASMNFYGMGTRAVFGGLSPGAKASSLKSAVDLRLRIAGRYAALLAGVAIWNYAKTGHADGGDSRIPIGCAYWGKDAKTGRPQYVNIIGMTPVGRGMRQFGLQALLQGYRQGQAWNQTADKALHAITGAGLQAWDGPIVSTALLVTTGTNIYGYHVTPRAKQGESQMTQNLYSAVEQMTGFGRWAGTGDLSYGRFSPITVPATEQERKEDQHFQRMLRPKTNSKSKVR
jgi:hypothetical protein